MFCQGVITLGFVIDICTVVKLVGTTTPRVGWAEKQFCFFSETVRWYMYNWISMRKICISSWWNFGNDFRVVSLLLRYDNYHQFSQIFIKVFIRSSLSSILPNKLQKPYLENMVIFMLLIMGHTDCPNTGIPTLILRNFMRAIITSACQVLIYAEEYYNEPTKVLHSILDWITI